MSDDPRFPELVQHLRSVGTDLAGVSPEAPLISSDAVDSLGLFHLVGWMEAVLGYPVDPATLSLGQEVDSIDDVLAWLDSHEERNDGDREH